MKVDNVHRYFGSEKTACKVIYGLFHNIKLFKDRKMKQILKLLSGMTLFVMAGCYPEKPSQTAVDAWEKSGADQLEIKKALLECGIQYLDGRFDTETSTDERFNAEESVNACMIQAGFQDKLGRVKWCEKYENLPICQPDAVIPQRSVERRLNSPHCEENKEQPECQP